MLPQTHSIDATHVDVGAVQVRQHRLGAAHIAGGGGLQRGVLILVCKWQ